MALRRFLTGCLPIAAIAGSAFVSCVGTQVVPVSAKLVAPYVCPSDSKATDVVSWSHGSTKGGHVFEWDLICIGSDGTGTTPGDWKVMAALFVLYLVLALLLFALYFGVQLVKRPKVQP